MFRQIRYQTGEASDVFEEMRNGNIPCLDVNDHDDFEAFSDRLLKYGIRKSGNIPYDRKARDGVTEPEFEFRAAFHPVEENKGKLPETMYIDVYFEPDVERTYDSVGEM